HPEGEDCAVEMENGAGKRRAHHAGLEVSWREADVDTDAEQDGHAAVEDGFDSSIGRSVRGLSAGCGRTLGYISRKNFAISERRCSCVRLPVLRRSQMCFIASRKRSAHLL